jgi:hypothetical protein
MTDSDTSASSTPNAPTKGAGVPWLGFRFVFGVVNGALWFVIPFVMVYWLSSTMPPDRLVQAKGLLVTVPTFFVAMFGLPGCLPAAVQQAKSGIFRMPKDPYPDGTRRGILGPLWLCAPVLGAAYFGCSRLFAGAFSDGTVTPFALARQAGTIAALVSFVQASTVSGSLSLLDLRPNRRETFGWSQVAFRTGVPQGLANGVLMALFVVAQGAPGTDAVWPFSRDLFLSCLGIGALVLLGGGGILGADLAVGRVVGVPGRVPSFFVRVGSVAMVAAVVTLPCAFLVALLGGAGPTTQWVANGMAGGTSAFLVATLAGHWALAAEANADSGRT